VARVCPGRDSGGDWVALLRLRIPTRSVSSEAFRCCSSRLLGDTAGARGPGARLQRFRRSTGSSPSVAAAAQRSDPRTRSTTCATWSRWPAWPRTAWPRAGFAPRAPKERHRRLRRSRGTRFVGSCCGRRYAWPMPWWCAPCRAGGPGPDRCATSFSRRAAAR
jgi:hypothetical protein